MPYARAIYIIFFFFTERQEKTTEKECVNVYLIWFWLVLLFLFLLVCFAQSNWFSFLNGLSHSIEYAHKDHKLIVQNIIPNRFEPTLNARNTSIQVDINSVHVLCSSCSFQWTRYIIRMHYEKDHTMYTLALRHTSGPHVVSSSALFFVCWFRAYFLRLIHIVCMWMHSILSFLCLVHICFYRL